MNVTAVAHCIACDTVRRARALARLRYLPTFATPNIATAPLSLSLLPARGGGERRRVRRQRPTPLLPSAPRRSGRGRQGTRCTTRPPLGRARLPLGTRTAAAQPSRPGEGLPHPSSAPSVCCRKCERLPDELRRLPELARRMAHHKEFSKVWRDITQQYINIQRHNVPSQCHSGARLCGGTEPPAPAAHLQAGREGAKARTLCAHPRAGSGSLGARGHVGAPSFSGSEPRKAGILSSQVN